MEYFANIEAEQAILGTIITNNIYYHHVSDILLPIHFVDSDHQILYEYISSGINQNAGTINKITLGEFFNFYLTASGGKNYLSVLFGAATGLVSIRDYAKIVIEMWQKRELDSILENSREKLKKTSFISVASDIENNILGLNYHEQKQKTQTTEEVINELEYNNHNNEFVSTGFEKLDILLDGGIYKQQLVIIGARPGIGKTSFGQNIILNVAKKNNSCLFMSLEVDKRNVIFKFISQLATVANWKLKRNLVLSELENQDVIKARSNLKKFRISINDSSQLRVGQINQIIKNFLVKNPIDLLVVDYIQIIKGEDTKNKNESTIIKDITTALKTIAKQYNIAVLALAQINRRAVEGRQQEPTINDFKSSGGIEEDADVCLILHRDRNDDKKDNYFSELGKIIVAKNRHGRTGEISIKFEGDYGLFREYEPLL